MIRLRGVRYRPHARVPWVLDDVSLHLAPGALLGVVGATATGKTTLLRIAATLIEPTHGEVRIDGHDAIAAPARARSRLGYVPHQRESSASPPRAALSLLADAWGLDRRAVDDVLDLTGVSAWADRAPDTLSCVERRRLSLAEALLHDPPALILDDPLSDVAPDARAWFVDVLTELAAVGKAVLVSAPERELLEPLCPRIATLAAGHLSLPAEELDP